MKTPPNKNNLMTETITHTMPSQPSIKKGKGEAGSTKVDSRMLILAAHFVSMLYAPFYLPVVAFMVLFIFSYLNLLPLQTKIVLTLIVYFFTILLPHFTIYLYRKFNGWTRHQMSKRERRFVPYILSIISYGALLYLLYNIHMPRFAMGVVGGALVIQIVCALVNSRIKISTHAAASGGVIGALMAFSFIFAFNPIGWLCLAILLCGMVSTARLILRQHTYAEIGWGVVVGIVSGFVSILLI
jgi:PAP2 superfamily domain protein